MPFLAENLGIITPDITRAMKKYDLPGILVLLFAFDESMPAILTFYITTSLATLFILEPMITTLYGDGSTMKGLPG